MASTIIFAYNTLTNLINIIKTTAMKSQTIEIVYIALMQIILSIFQNYDYKLIFSKNNDHIYFHQFRNTAATPIITITKIKIIKGLNLSSSVPTQYYSAFSKAYML